MTTAVNKSSPTAAKVTRKPVHERPGVVIDHLCVVVAVVVVQMVGRLLPVRLVVLELEKGHSLALGLVICLVGELVVVVGNTSAVCPDTDLPCGGDRVPRVSGFGFLLQMTSEVLVPVIFTPDVHLQERKGIWGWGLLGTEDTAEGFSKISRGGLTLSISDTGS